MLEESVSFINIQAIILYLHVNQKVNYISLKNIEHLLDSDQKTLAECIEKECKTYGITDVVVSLKRIYNIFDTDSDSETNRNINRENIKLLIKKILVEYDAILKMPENKRMIYIEENINKLKKIDLIGELQKDIAGLKPIDNFADVSNKIKQLVDIVDNRFSFTNKTEEILDFIHADYIDISVAKERVQTGWQEFDDMLGGGLVKTSLAVFCGQPGVGKTSTLVNVASNALKAGKSVLFFTFEELVSSISFYIIQSTFRLDESTLVRNQERYVNDFKDMLIKNNCNLYINEGLIKDKTLKDKGVSFSFIDIDNIIEKILAKGGKIDFIIFDYIGKMARMIQEDNLYLKVGNVAENLKEIARSMQIPVITAHQMNRMGWGSKDAGMENIADSVKIGHEADYMIFIIQSKADVKNGINRLLFRVDKNRHGPKDRTFEATPDYSRKVIELRRKESGYGGSNNIDLY